MKIVTFVIIVVLRISYCNLNYINAGFRFKCTNLVSLLQNRKRREPRTSNTQVITIRRIQICGFHFYLYNIVA
jgi:hypothetical protein